MASALLAGINEFLEVARRKSFAAAAVELGVSRSALSQAVQKLEARVGTALLSRTTRSVALTDAGRRLVEAAGPAVQQALAAVRSAGARTGALVGRIRLSVQEIAVPLVLAPLLPRFSALHPEVEVEALVDNRLVDIVADGFDAGIRLDEFLERDMVQVRVAGPGRWVVAGAPAYLERRGVPETPRDLLAHECLCYRSSTTGAIYAWELERGKRIWRVPVRGPIVSNHLGVIAMMAEAGAGLCYAYEPAIADALQRGSLRIVLEAFAPAVGGLFLYYPSRASVSPAFRAFIDVARELGKRRG